MNTVMARRLLRRLQAVSLDNNDGRSGSVDGGGAATVAVVSTEPPRGQGGQQGQPGRGQGGSDPGLHQREKQGEKVSTQQGDVTPEEGEGSLRPSGGWSDSGTKSSGAGSEARGGGVLSRGPSSADGGGGGASIGGGGRLERAARSNPGMSGPVSEWLLELKLALNADIEV